MRLSPLFPHFLSFCLGFWLCFVIFLFVSIFFTLTCWQAARRHCVHCCVSQCIDLTYIYKHCQTDQSIQRSLVHTHTASNSSYNMGLSIFNFCSYVQSTSRRFSPRNHIWLVGVVKTFVEWPNVSHKDSIVRFRGSCDHWSPPIQLSYT